MSGATTRVTFDVTPDAQVASNIPTGVSVAALLVMAEILHRAAAKIMDSQDLIARVERARDGAPPMVVDRRLPPIDLNRLREES